MVGNDRDFASSKAGSHSNRALVYGWRGWKKMSRTSECSTTSPAYITTTSSHNSAISPKLCDTSMTVDPNSERASRIKWMIWASIVTSSAVVGSSVMSRAGSISSAIPIPARWRIPPLN